MRPFERLARREAAPARPSSERFRYAPLIGLVIASIAVWALVYRLTLWAFS